jgi:hypothetical protein
MPDNRFPPKRRQRICRAAPWLLCAWLVLSGYDAQSQSTSLSGSIDARSPDSPHQTLHGVKLIVRDRRTKKVVGKPQVADQGNYSITFLSAGNYEIFACDSALRYEPGRRQAHLNNGGSSKKDLHLRNDYATVVAPRDDDGRKPDPNVRQLCLVHKETGCKAVRPNTATISIPGPETEYEVLTGGDEPCE